MNLNYKKIFIILLSFSILIAINSLFLHQIALGVLASAVYFYFLSFILGKIFFGEKSKSFRLIFGFLFALGLLSLFSSILIEVGILFKTAILAFLITLSFFAFLLKYGRSEQEIQTLNDDQIINPAFSKLTLVLFFIFSLFLIIILFASRTGDYIYRLWNALPQFYWYIFALSTIALAGIIIDKLDIKIKLFAIILISLIIHSSILVILKTEYDGDGYRHLGTEKFLLLEKPLYTPQTQDPSKFVYVGAWGLHASLTQITTIPIDIIHNIFPWLLASIFPLLILFQIGILFFKSRLPALILAVTPLFFYEINVHSMISNPKTIGFIFLIFSLFLALRYLIEERKIGLAEIIIPIASILIYPVTGIFSFLCVFLAIILKIKSSKIRKLLILITSVFAFLIIPILDLKSGSVIPTQNYLGLFFEIFVKWFSSIFSAGWQVSFPILLYFLITLGIVTLSKDKEKKSGLNLLLILFFALQFAFGWRLMFKEQPAFSSRIGIPFYSAMFLFITAGIISLKNSFNNFSKKIRMISIFVILPAFILSAYYFSPVTWNISTREIGAIKFIDQENPDRDYIVLTEEITSAAANGILGYTIAPYYRYPGGELQQYFIRMTQNPSLETLEEAKKFFLVKYVYFIINPLPPFNEQVLEKTKKILPIYKQFDDKVYIFRYPS